MSDLINMRRHFIFFITGVFCSVIHVWAQDWKADLERAGKIYSEENLELEMELHFFSSPTASTPVEKEKVWMYKAGDNCRVKQFGIDMIYNSEYMVLIDEKNQIISLERAKKKEKEKEKDEPVSEETKELLQNAVKELVVSLGIDTVLSKPQFSSDYLGETGKSRIYRFLYSQGKYLESTVYLSTATGLLEKVSCLLRNPVEISKGVFNQVKIDFVFLKQIAIQKPNQNLFSTDEIFSANATGEIILRDRYRQYRLIVKN